MRINTNVASLNAQSNASQTNSKIQSSLEKLSSGLRINKAADDASGMAIADKLRTQASAVGQGISNANSGSALIQIADKALGEQSSILDTVKTKLIQAGTSTTSEEGREAIRKDVSKLLEQLDNISEQTNYNGVNLLNEKGASFNFQVGENADSDIGVTNSFAVNTKGLGSASAAENKNVAEVKYSASIEMEGEAKNVSTTVKGSSGAVNIAAANSTSTSDYSDATIEVSAEKVTGFGIKSSAASGDGVILTTDDATLIAALDAADTNSPALVKISEGTYTLKSSTAGAESVVNFQNNVEVDISKLKVSGLSSETAESDSFSIITTEDVTIDKISGDKDLTISGSAAATPTTAAAGTLTGKNDPDSASGIDYGTSVLTLQEGTMNVKNETTNEYIALNTDPTTTTIEDLDMTIAGDSVKELTVRMTAGQASITLKTDDANLNSKLEELANSQTSLTKKEDGSFILSATSMNANATLDFGDEGIDISGLQISGVQNGANLQTSEAVYIKTNDELSVTNNSTSTTTDIGDISIRTASDAVGVATASFTTELMGADVPDSKLSRNLDGLANLAEGGLTSDIANQYMEVIDNAITQLNSVRSDFGSTQSQLDVATRNMMVTQVNIKSAESVIRDVDYAQESANFNKQNIISQAGTYAMSQANSMQQNVMRLLQ